MARISALAILLAAMGTGASAQDGFGGWSNDGLVRDQARAGYVPTPDAFHVEGLLAEHHFPAREQRCASRFCVLGAVGHGIHRPSQQRSAYLVVEPVSGFDPSTFSRPPLDLAIVVDQSGSMQGWKLDAAKAAAHALVERLDERDRVSIVAFSETAVVHQAPQPVDRDALHASIEAIEIAGGTNIHAGLSLGYDQLEGGDRFARVILLTDERPNVGATGRDDFMELIGTNAAQGRALTVIGVGLDLGAELANAMSQIEGGAMHYLEGPEAAPTLFEDLRRFVVPVAYGLSVHVEPSSGLRVAEVFGVPDDRVTLHPDGSATFRASTVFFDPIRRGAVARLAPTEPGSAAATDADVRIRFSYRLPETGRRYQGERRVHHHSERPNVAADFPSPGAYLAYALVSYAEELRAGLREWHAGNHARAERHIRAARHYLHFDRAVVRDGQLDDERATIDDVLAAMGSAKP